MEIRFVRPEEEAALAKNIVTGFPSKTPPELLARLGKELREPEEGLFLGCFLDDGSLAGSILMMDFQLNVRGRMMKMGGIAYVSTSTIHKKEHVARNLIRVACGIFVGTGTPVGALHPFNPAFYEKMGYGYCNEMMMYAPRPQYIRSYGDKSDLSYATETDREELLAFYRKWARKQNGATIHPFMDVHRIFDSPYVVICRRNGRITGYLTFSFEEVDHYTDMYHDLKVPEMIYEDRETLQQFLTFLASQTDQIDRVRIYSPVESFQMYFTNPDSGENRAHDGAIQEIGRKTMGFLFRILDVEAYFKEQTHCEHQCECSFILELAVSDSFIEANNRSFYLSVSGKEVCLTEETCADVRLECDIEDLSSLVIGAISLKDFLWSDRMRCSDEARTADLQSALGWSEKPRNYTYF